MTIGSMLRAQMLKKDLNLMVLIVALLVFINCDYQKEKTQPLQCPSVYDSILKKDVVTFAEIMPEYPGGCIALMKFIQKKLIINKADYPLSVTAVIVVNPDGKVIRASIKKKRSKDLTELERKLLKILNSMNGWKPAQCSGKKVTFQMSLSLKI